MRPIVVSSVIVLMSSMLAGLAPDRAVGRAQGLGDQLHRRTVKELAAGKLLVSA